MAESSTPNDGAELAPRSLSGGSAMAAMVDYLLEGTGKSVTLA